MRRKFLSVVLCVCMMLTMAPFAFAAGTDTGSNTEGAGTSTPANSSSGAGGGGSVTPVAQVGDTTYGTLRAAVAAVPENGTITLLKDATGSGIGTYKDTGTDKDGNTKITSKSFTIDFNGHTYSLNTPAVGSTGYETQGFHFEWKGSAENIPNITLKNGTLDVASEHDSNLKLLIQNYCDLTLDNMIVDGSNLENGWGTYTYITSNCCGTTLIKDTKIFGGDAQKNVAFDVDGCRSAYANTPVKITVEGNSEILGRIEVNDSDNKSENTLTVKDGSFTDVATAVKYAENNATIKVAQDTTSDVVVPADKTITLDLNGNKLTNKTNHTILNNGTLTITGTGTVDNVTHQKAALYNKGTATLEGGTFDRTKENGKTKEQSGNNSWYTIKNVGTMTVKDGVTVQTAGNNNSLGKFSSLVSNGYFNNSDFTNNKGIDNPNLTIEGGNFLGGLNTIKNDDRATLTINNGTFSNYYQAVVQNHNVAEIKGGTFTAASDATSTTFGVDNCGCAEGTDLGTLTISGGTFAGATYAVFDRSTQSPNITISAGNFAAAKASIAKSTTSNATISVTGGYFTSDPTAYVASGYAAVETTKPGYNYEVITAEPTKAEVSTADPDVQLPDNLKSDVAAQALQSSLKEATDLVDGDGLTAAAKTIANRNTITKDAATNALKTAGLTPMEGTNVRVVVQTYMDINITAVDTTSLDKKTLSLDITPMYRTVATTANTDSEIELTGTDVPNANAVLVGPAGKLIINKPVTIKIPLPTDFVSPATTGANDYPSIYVQHKGYEYTASVSNQSGTLYATFTNPHGFSSFTITAAPTAVAEVNGTSYINFQDAVDAVENGGAIKALKDINSTVSGNKTFTVNANSNTVTLTAASGYTLTKDDAGKYTVSPQSSGGPGSSGGSISAPTTYAVNVNAATNGAVAADKKTASKGTTVTVTASPSKGYVVDAVKVVDKDGKDVAVTGKDGKYVFTMPGSAVTVTGTFKAETPAPVALPFSDVKSGNWFYDAVKYAYEQGLMTGTSATTFAPNGTMNRAMIVTVLYRLENSPAVTGASKFTDVPAGQWYSDAVAWAAANKIVNGYDETTFGPMNAVTREQMAAILFRYEQVKGLENVTLEENLNRFPDQNKISAYAIPALQWAVGQKIINGNADGTLDPTGTATRAQVAQIFTNLLNK